MNTREKLHEKIDELLTQLQIHNNRLSLHDEKISHLDLDVLRKLCIDLYEDINKLALSGRLSTNGIPEKEQEIEEKKDEIPVAAEEQVKQELNEPKTEVPASKVRTEVKKKPADSRKYEEEMMSLFERYSNKPIESIAGAISISKRFQFQQNFFDGDAKEYKQFINALDKAGGREEAFEIYHEYKNKLKWDNEELKDELKSLLYRKYHT